MEDEKRRLSEGGGDEISYGYGQVLRMIVIVRAHTYKQQYDASSSRGNGSCQFGLSAAVEKMRFLMSIRHAVE